MIWFMILGSWHKGLVLARGVAGGEKIGCRFCRTYHPTTASQFKASSLGKSHLSQEKCTCLHAHPVQLGILLRALQVAVHGTQKGFGRGGTPLPSLASPPPPCNFEQFYQCVPFICLTARGAQHT